MTNEDVLFPDQFQRLGRERTKPILRLAYMRDDVSITDALAAAYLQGVWDGWLTRQAEIEKEKSVKI